jgi:hypothetical protein
VLPRDKAAQQKRLQPWLISAASTPARMLNMVNAEWLKTR